jgi:reverse gyrase
MTRERKYVDVMTVLRWMNDSLKRHRYHEIMRNNDLF